MNKQKARKLADAGGISIGALREMITASRGKRSLCAINPQLTHEQALDIFQEALAGRDDTEIPKTLTADFYHPGRMKPTKDNLIIANILRVCAP